MIKSPNTVLANSLEDSLDLMKPRLEINKPNEVIFSVGTQINGYPHIGTYLVQASAFVLAREVRGKFGVQTKVEFGALDNAPFKVIDTHAGPYQIDWGHAEGADGVSQLINESYIPYFEELSRLTGVGYSWSTYTDQQANTDFRQMFLESLAYQEKIRWCVAPSSGILRIRIPCPRCYFAQKYADNTILESVNTESACFSCLCYEHGLYEVEIGLSGDGYFDLNTLYRNLVKEAVYASQKDTLAVMVKGGDWIYSTQPVDWALAAMGLNGLQVPMRLFTPQVLTSTGAKLSKSLIRDGDTSMWEVPDWLLDMSKFREMFSSKYAKVMVWLVQQFLSHPRHFYRSFTFDEIIRLVSAFKEQDLDQGSNS